MGNLTIAFTFIWMLNLLVFFAQAAMIDINPTTSTQFYNCNGTLFSSYATDSGCTNISVPNSQGAAGELPVSATQVSPSTGFGIVDAISSASNWITGKAQTFIAILMGPYNILNSISSLPKIVVAGVSLLWYGITILLTAAFILGRDN